MNIYLISQSVNNAYDTYDSAVVIAEDEEMAKMTHPDDSKNWDGIGLGEHSWCAAVDVDAKLVGTANSDHPIGVVCASYNAG